MLLWATRRPHYLIFYVTSKCNLRCKHCFYLEELGQHDDLSLQEIQRVAEGVAPLDFLRLTGGEPLLRKDLPEIIALFYTHARTRRMGVISNGTLPQRTLPLVERIFELSPNLTLDLGVSIDGLQDIHDEMRGAPSTFEKARATVQTLVENRERFPGLLTSLVITVSGKNLHQLDALYDELSTWGVDRLSVNMVRGRLADDTLKQVPFARYREFAERLEAYHKERQRGLKPILQRGKNRLTRKAIEQVVNGQASDLPCKAADAICVLYSDGAVSVCETLDDVPKEALVLDGQPVEPLLGNLRENGYDLRAVLNGEKADRARRWIEKTRCSCTHECFLTASILWGGLATAPALLKESFTPRPTTAPPARTAQCP